MGWTDVVLATPDLVQVDPYLRLNTSLNKIKRKVLHMRFKLSPQEKLDALNESHSLHDY